MLIQPDIISDSLGLTSAIFLGQAPDPALDHLLQLPPHERVAAVKPFWRSLDQLKQLELLSLDVNELREAAKSLADAAKQHAGEYGIQACYYQC